MFLNLFIFSALILMSSAADLILTDKRCDFETLDLLCFESKIEIIEANYGRWKSDNKCGPSSVINCVSSTVNAFIKKMCNNQEDCSINVNPSILGDPCPGTKKMFEVIYKCVKNAPRYPQSKPQYPESKVEGPTQGSGQQYPQKGNGQQYPQQGSGQQYPQQGNGQQYPQQGSGQQYPQQGNRQQYPQLGNGQQYPQLGNGQQYPQQGNGQQYPQQGIGQQYPQHGNGRNQQPSAQVNSPQYPHQCPPCA